MNQNTLSPKELARKIDFSILKPEFTLQQITTLAKEGVELNCYSLCINPKYIELCSDIVKETKTSLTPVVDFPFGSSSTKSRIEQILDVCKYESVKEIDIVINYGLLKSNELQLVRDDLKAIKEICLQHEKLIKVILETDALNEEEILKGCQCCLDADIDFVKTSTGFYTGGATVGASIEVIELIQGFIQGRTRIKASGHIRDRDRFLKLVEMGVDRCGINALSARSILYGDDNE